MTPRLRRRPARHCGNMRGGEGVKLPLPLQQFRQPGEIDRHPARLVQGEHRGVGVGLISVKGGER